MNTKLIKAFLLYYILKICICDQKTNIEKILDDQNIKYKYFSTYQEIEISEPHEKLNLIIKDQKISTYIKFYSNQNISSIYLQNVEIDIKYKDYFSFVNFLNKDFITIDEIVIFNVTSNVPILSSKLQQQEQQQQIFIRSAQIINSFLPKGFGQFNSINFKIENLFVDKQTIQQLGSSFIGIKNLSDFQLNNSYLGIDSPLKNQSLLINKLRALQQDLYNDKYNKKQKEFLQTTQENTNQLNFIEIECNNQFEGANDNIIINNTIANFNDMTMRFLKFMKYDNNNNNLQKNIFISNSSFKNMKALDFGGAIYIMGYIPVNFKNVIFDQCQSGYLGGALYLGFIQNYQNLTIQNCKSKIGGGSFNVQAGIKSEIANQNDVKFANNSAIYRQDLFVEEIKPNQQPIECSLFEFDSLYQYNQQFQNTSLFMIKQETTKQIFYDDPIYTTYQSVLKKGMMYVIRLKICDIVDFTEDMYVGNLYHLVPQDKKYQFYPLQIKGINYPYLVTIYSLDQDCSNNLGFFNFLFYFDFFNTSSLNALTFNYGCFNHTQTCEQGMEEIYSPQSNLFICQYCGYGLYKDDLTQKCEICNTNNFDQCYANYTKIKNQFWRAEDSSAIDVYSCQLNKHSCVSENRMGFGNDLCSEGYIGAQCLSCDTKGQIWGGKSYGIQGSFQCVKCSNLKNNNIIIYLSFSYVLLIFFITLFSSYYRMKKQILRKYLSQLQIIYIGTSFVRQSQMSIYIKILFFNFQMYLVTYYYVDFNKNDSSLHSSIYSFLNPLQYQESTSLDCFLISYFPNQKSIGYLKLLLTVTSPIILNCIVLIILSAISFIKKKKYYFVLILSFTYSVVFIFQSSIIKYSIESLQCLQLTNKDKYLTIDPQINCSNEEWMLQMRILNIPALLFYIIIIPFGLFIYIFKQRNFLEDTKMILLFGFLYDEYKKKYYYWQFVKIALTISLSILIALLRTQILLSGLVYCGILTVYNISILKYKPFKQTHLNRIESISITLSILYLLASQSLQITYAHIDQYDKNGSNVQVASMFYYLVLFCQTLFYLYVIILIIASSFQFIIQKLQRFQLFQYISKCFPSVLQKVYSRQLRDNFKKLRLRVKEIQNSKKQQMHSSQQQENELQIYSFHLAKTDSTDVE